MTFQYWLGYTAGRWQQSKKRANWQYVRGYIAGMFGKLKGE
jgi:hypothetical protein